MPRMGNRRLRKSNSAQRWTWKPFEPPRVGWKRERERESEPDNSILVLIVFAENGLLDLNSLDGENGFAWREMDKFTSM